MSDTQHAAEPTPQPAGEDIETAEPAAVPSGRPAMDDVPVPSPAPDVDELEKVTAELRTLQRGRTLRPSQAALIVLLALLVGAMIAPLLWLTSRGTATPAGVTATDPAVAALQAYQRTVDGSPASTGDKASIASHVHVRTSDTGDTIATARGTTGICYVLTIPAVTAPNGQAGGITTGDTTDCS